MRKDSGAFACGFLYTFTVLITLCKSLDTLLDRASQRVLGFALFYFINI